MNWRVIISICSDSPAKRSIDVNKPAKRWRNTVLHKLGDRVRTLPDRKLQLSETAVLPTAGFFVRWLLTSNPRPKRESRVEVDMPRVKRKGITRREELPEEVILLLHCGHWFSFDLHEQPDMETLAELWQEHEPDLLANYAPPSWCEDRPTYGEYVFSLVPRHGTRRGIGGATHDGYFVDERDAEPWRDYYRRCGIKKC
jgi:hypothetical protein